MGTLLEFLKLIRKCEAMISKHFQDTLCKATICTIMNVLHIYLPHM